MSNTTEAAVRSAVAAWLSVGVGDNEELIATLMKLIDGHTGIATTDAVKVALAEAAAKMLEIVKDAKRKAADEQLEQNCKAICVDCAEGLPLMNYRGHAVHNNGRTCEAVAIRSQI